MNILFSLFSIYSVFLSISPFLKHAGLYTYIRNIGSDHWRDPIKSTPLFSPQKLSKLSHFNACIYTWKITLEKSLILIHSLFNFSLTSLKHIYPVFSPFFSSAGPCAPLRSAWIPPFSKGVGCSCTRLLRHKHLWPPGHMLLLILSNYTHCSNPSLELPS